ncbi:MAG: FimB/Mfa2 family fimbrial subunit [Tannerella sp.]|nr:FimB/Mfa2 family fimbrial subunit [Tannerella sp.]
MIRRLVKYIQYSSLGILFLLVSCLKDDLSDCPVPGNSSYIRFVYDYNLAYEDLFHKQVSNVELYLYDRDGIFIRKLTDEVANGTFPKDYKIEIPEDIRQDVYYYIAWAGLHNDHHQATTPIPGTSHMKELTVKLKPRDNSTVNTIINPLWYGTLLPNQIKEENASQDNVRTISMIKNTNAFRIILQTLNKEPIDVNQFDFRLESVNGSYTYQNDVASTETWTYEPFSKKNDPAAGAVAELHTMRLLDDRVNRLVIQQKSANAPLININLNDYLKELNLELYSHLSLQEYMDREDSFKILIFIGNNNPTNPGEDEYVAASIDINGWETRIQQVEY